MGSFSISFDESYDIIDYTTLNVDYDFAWDVGDTPIYYYRIMSRCLIPSCGEATAQNSGITGDIASCNENSKKQIMTVIAARNLSEVGQILHENSMTQPWQGGILSIYRYTTPAYADNIAADEALGIDHSCNGLEEMAFEDIPELQDFLAQFLAFDAIGVTTTLVSMDYVFVTPVVLPVGGVLYFSGEVDDYPVYDYAVLQGIDASAVLVSLEMIGVDEDDTPELAVDTTTVLAECACTRISKNITMSQNLVYDNDLFYSLRRSDNTLSTNIVLRYDAINQNWRYNTRFVDVGVSWDILFDWGCTDDVFAVDEGPLAWRFHMLIRKNELIAGRNRSLTTKVLIYSLADPACSVMTPRYKFSLDVSTGIITMNTPFVIVEDATVIIDNIGLFKGSGWTDRPFIVSVVLDGNSGSTNQFSLKPLIERPVVLA